jgi:hypothetical protein
MPRPLLDQVEPAFDDVAAAVGLGVELRRSAAVAAASSPVSDLVGPFRDVGW